MTNREQLQNVCRWNRELVRENSRLHEELSCVNRDRDELSDANANLRVELRAADGLLGTAMDEALRARQL
ncbi:MAG TPA: hypothetical protein VFY36_06140 [Solirubrobacteraceae bacterium]|nr:hypothetical protein [Solirubrobacteraceae bacterium]